MGTGIPYCDEVWNVCVGCTKIKSGCQNCWAEKLHNMRHKALLAHKKMPNKYRFPFSAVGFMPDRLDIPLHWRKPRTIFVNSMSDTFHEDMPFDFIAKIFAVMAMCPQHKFLLFTKRWERCAEFYDRIYLSESGVEFMADAIEDLGGDPDAIDSAIAPPMDNVSLYFSASTQSEVDEAVPILLKIPVAVRGLSLEPLLGPVDLREWIADCGCVGCQKHYFTDMDELVLPENDNAKCPECDGEIVSFSGYTNEHEQLRSIIVGCESGPKRRLCKIEEIKRVADQCKAAGVPCYVKQIPIDGKCVTLNKNTESIWPEWAVREMPK